MWPLRLHSHPARALQMRDFRLPEFPPALMLIPAATDLSQPRESSFYLGGQPGKAPPLTALIGLFIFWCRCCFGCLATQWWSLPVPRGAINEWADIFMLGAVAIARAEHCRICNSTCPECAFPIMLREKSNAEYLVGEETEKEFSFRKWQTSLRTVPYSQSYLPTRRWPYHKNHKYKCAF